MKTIDAMKRIHTLLDFDGNEELQTLMEELIKHEEAQAVEPVKPFRVGDSKFESWYSEVTHSKESKQGMREAYEAGMNDRPTPAPSGQRAELVAELRSACIDGTLHSALVTKAADMLAADAQEIDDLKSSEDFYQRRVVLLQEWQSKMRDPERKIACDIIANGQMLPPENAGNRYKITYSSVISLPMDSAPRDGTIVRLLVDFEDGALEDTDQPVWTIGANYIDQENAWQFAGWNWTHDCFTEGSGTPIGWLPMLDETPQLPQADAQRVPMTDDQLWDAFYESAKTHGFTTKDQYTSFGRAVEAHHGIKT